MRVAIVGEQGGLASALRHNLAGHFVTYYSKKEYDISQKDNVETLAAQIFDNDIIICCAGVHGQDGWDTFVTNIVGPAYLLECLTSHNSNARVIILGSHSASWTSWPGIDVSRLSYNNSKSALKHYVLGLEHSGNSNLKLTILNPTRFQTSMSDNTGYPIDVVIKAIDYIVNAEVPPLIYELGSYRE